MVMLMDGQDPTKASLDQLMAAIDKIEEAQNAGQIRRFTGNDYTGDLAKGNLWVAMAYSGDLVQLQADNPNLEFVYPEEGAMLFTDNLMMPPKAEHPYAAETMMNYVYDPEEGVVHTFNKWRGIGDCGTSGTWRWDEFEFRLVEFRANEECAEIPDEEAAMNEYPLVYSAAEAAAN